MSNQRTPYLKLDSITEFEDLDKANEHINRYGWVFLGFFARSKTPLGGETYQVPVYVLGEPSSDQEL